MDKPSGILSQKAVDEDVSMNEMMLSYLIHTGKLSQEAFETFHPSVANRLDRNTSGLLLAGKSLKGQQMLSEALRERSAEKYYQCVVKGVVEDAMVIEGYLTKDHKTNQVRISNHMTEDAKRIATAYQPVAWNDKYTLLSVHLITGRTHQIRAHLASIHHPILGDPKYGDAKENRFLRETYGIRHQLLHAYHLKFENGQEFVSPVPKIFQQLVK